ncbi:hypothetical protein PQX77_008692 [Marasmius sp. AFHP31]|nr:hypothetical protein PQX77_008692 [Marasmius sp. AFHP31]
MTGAEDDPTEIQGVRARFLTRPQAGNLLAMSAAGRLEGASRIRRGPRREVEKIELANINSPLNAGHCLSAPALVSLLSTSIQPAYPTIMEGRRSISILQATIDLDLSVLPACRERCWIWIEKILVPSSKGRDVAEECVGLAHFCSYTSWIDWK